jgi:hypothetical protein
MARLDSSFMGRPLERLGKLFNYTLLGNGLLISIYSTISHFLDAGFAAYASYLHMEVTYTNPVMLG